MNLISRKVTPKIKLYYLGAKPDWDLVKKVSGIFDGSAEPFKTKHRHQVYLLEHNSEVYYIKKFIPPTIEQKLSYYFRQSKAVSCLNIAYRLRASGFKVVEPVFALDYQKNIQHASILVTKKAEGINLLDFFNRDFGSYENNEVMKCFMSTLGSFYKNNFLHYDPILTNFMIVPEKKPHEIIFLDFDSIIYNSWVSQGRTFIFISKLFYFFFAFLVSQNNEKECSRERILYYLEMFIKSYNPAIKTDDAYKYLIHGTIKLLKRKDKLSIKNKSLLSKIIESNAY